MSGNGGLFEALNGRRLLHGTVSEGKLASLLPEIVDAANLLTRRAVGYASRSFLLYDAGTNVV